MPAIEIIDETSSITITSQQSTPALAHYLQKGLVFVLDKANSAVNQAKGKQVSDVDTSHFPVSLSPSIPQSFAVSSATVSVNSGLGASIDLLTGKKGSDFTKSLGPNTSSASSWACFAFTADLSSGPSGTVGDFSFGLVSGAEIKVSNYCPVPGSDIFEKAIERAISGLTLPHDLDDIRALPEGNICKLAGKASLKFTASVQYSLLTNTLATAPFEVLSQAPAIKAHSGPKLQVSVEHSNAHELTLASLGNNKFRLNVSLTAEADAEESFDFSIGVSGNIAGMDALQFLVEHVSEVPDKDLAQIKAILSAQEQDDLSGQIKTVVQAATKGGITASIREALKQSKAQNSLFAYDIDLSAIDTVSTHAIESALKGDFTQLTALGSNLAGIHEVKSVSTLTLTQTNTLNIHLLGILNFSDVSTFLKKVKVAHVGDTSDIVLAATDIKVVQNTIEPDHLREVLTKSAMITIAADSSPKNPDFTFQMVFFLEKANVSESDLQQIYNALKFISAPAAATVQSLLDQPSAHRPDADLYLSLKLDKNASAAIFKSRTTDDFVLAGQKAMAAMLANDPESANRLPLFSVDQAFWKQLRQAGAAPNVQALLTERGMTSTASWTDFVTIDWWAKAMGNMAAAIAAETSLLDAEKEVLKKSEAGFDIPWALLATASLIPTAKVTAQFATSTTKQPKTMTASGI